MSLAGSCRSLYSSAVESARTMNTVLIGDDTDLLILLCYYMEMVPMNCFSSLSQRPIQEDDASGTWKFWKRSKVKMCATTFCSSMQFLVVIQLLTYMELAKGPLWRRFFLIIIFAIRLKYLIAHLPPRRMLWQQVKRLWFVFSMEKLTKGWIPLDIVGTVRK